MDRRTFVGAVASGFLIAPNIARTQQVRKVAVVGILRSSPDARSLITRTLREGLRDLGYVEGQNFVLESRSATGGPEQLPGDAAELVRLNVDVIVAIGPAAVRAARDATSVLPIVAIDLETDPVASGFARSLGRPGGNITGLFLDLPGLAGKWLGLLREAVPKIQNVGVLWDSGTGSAQLAAVKAAALALVVTLQVLEVRNADDIDTALGAGLNMGAKALVMLSSPLTSVRVYSNRIVEFAANNRLPAISPFRIFTEAGGLMSYGPDQAEFYRRVAPLVDKILKGARPSDLPIELPNKFELVINMKTAKALRLTMPQSLLLRADEVIR